MSIDADRRLIPGFALAALLAGLTGCSSFQPWSRPTQNEAAPAETARAGEPTTDQAAIACLTIARGLEKSGKDDAALEQYEKVLKLDPENLSAHRRMAVLYDRRGDFAKADVEYKQVAKIKPRDADLLTDWGYSYYLRNDWNEAARHLQRALELDPKNERARCNLGLTMGQLGRYDQALQLFHDAGLSDGEAHCDLAFVYWSQGRLVDARRECQTARKLDPHCDKAVGMLARLDAQPPTPAAPSRTPSPTDRRAAEARTIAGLAGLPSGPSTDQPVYRTSNGTAWVPLPQSNTPTTSTAD
jgi:Flp pilus assembly protein TadD